MAKRYHINELIAMNRLDIMQIPKGVLEVEFADKTVNTTSRRIILSWHFWKLLRAFPVTEPIPSKLLLGPGRLTKGDELKLCERVIWFTHRNSEAYREELKMLANGEEPVERLIWRIAEASYRAINEIHNFTVTDISNYGTTSDLEDLMQICGSQLVIDLKEQLRRGEIDFPEANALVSEYITSDAVELRYNGLAMMARANLLSSKQLYQMVLSRGYAESVNGEVFKEPIYNSFTDGMNNLYDSLTESRSAAKSLYMNDGPLKQSEYLNRRLQLLVSIIHSASGHDCGTRDTLSWLVDKGDHAALEGRFHFVDMAGAPYCPKPDDTYYVEDPTRPCDMTVVNTHNISLNKAVCKLVPYEKNEAFEGQVIYLRSITLCRNHNPSTVCETCMGHVVKSFVPTTNIGHFLAIGPISQLSQLILSTKHVDTSSGSEYLYLSDGARGWLKLDTQNPSKVIMKRRSPKGNYRLLMAIDDLPGLNTIRHTDAPEQLMAHRLSRVKEIKIGELDANGEVRRDYTGISTVVGGAGAALSVDVIVAMKRNGWRERGDVIEVDLLDFNDRVLLVTPSRTEDMLTYQKRVKGFLFGSQGRRDAKGDSIVSYNAPAPAVNALYGLLRERIKNVSLLQAEIFVKACMTVNGSMGNYNLPRGGEPFEFKAVHSILMNRSISAALAYESQKMMIKSPSTYINHDRHAHGLDAML